MDRVIFNDNGEYVDLITHQGAKGNDFVECEITPDIAEILQEIFDQLNDSILQRLADIVNEFNESQEKIKSSINTITDGDNNIGSDVAGAIEAIA